MLTVLKCVPLLLLCLSRKNCFNLLHLFLTHVISLGNAAVFLIGGLTRDAEPTPILLRSGDVVIMSGPECRRAYHGESGPSSHEL